MHLHADLKAHHSIQVDNSQSQIVAIRTRHVLSGDLRSFRSRVLIRISDGFLLHGSVRARQDLSILVRITTSNPSEVRRRSAAINVGHFPVSSLLLRVLHSV
jgi:hypothetical protein